MTRRMGSIALTLLAASAAASPRQVLADPADVRIERSGFATVEQVPPSPFPDRLPPPENRPRTEGGYYARMAGISDSEARRRLAQQQAARPEFERLLAALRRREAGNFTDARMVHSPDWAYIFYFKTDPERTLAKYTSNPHFKAARARYSRSELDSIARPWIERFEQHRLLGGYGSDATYGEVRMDLVVSEAEYRALAEKQAWRLPDPLKLNFSDAVEGPGVAEPARRLIRLFPQSDRALGPTHQALLGGRILLRDGCLYVTGPNQPERLAYFAREVALGFDDQGYLALRTRGPAPRHLGRIGEQSPGAGRSPRPRQCRW